MEEQILPETNSPEKKRAPISRHARLYFLILSVVVILLVFFSLDYFNKMAREKTLVSVETVGAIEHNEPIYDLECDEATPTPKPTPKPEISWNGNVKTIDYHNGLKKIETYDDMSKKGKGLIFRFSLSIAVMVTGIGILSYFLIRDIQIKKKTGIIACIVVMTAWLVGCIFVCLWIHKELNDRCNFVSDGNRGVMYIDAPIIYLYDEQEREISVKLNVDGELTCTYPAYGENGWVVRASSDGTLTDSKGRNYEYLFYEACGDLRPDHQKGFCVKREDSVEFLEKALDSLGLTEKEANTFIMYWLPQLEESPYNVISFQTEAFERFSELQVSPVPDTIIRVNMYFYPSDRYVEIEAQDLSSINPSLEERKGFVLVEWGGEKEE